MRSHNPAEYDMIAKIILFGDYSAGKTSILMRYVDNEFDPHRMVANIGVEFRTKIEEINHKKIKFQVWDVVGADRFRTLFTSYFRGAHGVLLIFDITNPDAFVNLRDRINAIREYQRNSNSRIFMILFGNKSDLEEERVISSSQTDEFAREHGISYVQGSAKEDINIDQAFEMMGTYISNSFVPPTPRPRPIRRNFANDQLPDYTHRQQKYGWLTIIAPALLLTIFVFLALITNN